MNLSAVLDDCLQRLQAGETIAGCVARYPDHAADLAPMLAVAAQISRLADQQPTEDQRQRTLARLRQAAANQRAVQPSQVRTGWLAPMFAARRLVLVAAVALLLLATLSAGVVASSQPGQPAYALRVIVERAPAWVSFDPTARAVAELNTADRRLSDLQSHLERAGQVQPAALRAMLAGDQAAARQALAATEIERLRVIERLATRARLLAGLAETAGDPATAQALATAARSTQALVDGLQAGPAGPAPSVGPANGAGEPATPTPTATATASPTTTPSNTATAGGASDRWTATPTASAAPNSPTPKPDSQAPPRPRPSQTATVQITTPGPHQSPRPQLTALAQTATAQTQTAAPEPTPTATPDEPQSDETATPAHTPPMGPPRPRSPGSPPAPPRPTGRP